VPHLGSSLFTCKERHAYFNMSLILGDERRVLLILIFIYSFSVLEIYIYM
jgi:hypothetical protein